MTTDPSCDVTDPRLAADRPAALPAQSTTALHDERGAALGTAGSRRRSSAAHAGNEDLAVAAAVPVDGDSLATQLVRELVRGFDVDRRGPAMQVDRLADGSVRTTLPDRLHAHVRRHIDVVGRWEPALDLGGHSGEPACRAALADRGEQLVAG